MGALLNSPMREFMKIIENAQADRVWYHGSDRVFAAFNTSEIGSRMGRGSPGFWFTDNPELTGFYGHIQYAARLLIQNPKIITQKDWEVMREGKSPSLQAVLAARDDYDALIIEGIWDGDAQSTICCVFDPDQIEIISNNGEDQIEEAMDVGGYKEQTIFLPGCGGYPMEVHGDDGYGWYAEKKHAEHWNREIKVWRRSEKLKNKEPEEGEPVPMVLTPSKNRLFVYLGRADGQPMTRDWLTMNGAFLSSDDE